MAGTARIIINIIYIWFSKKNAQNKQQNSDPETSQIRPGSFLCFQVWDENVFNFTSMDAIFEIL